MFALHYLATADYKQSLCPIGHYCTEGILTPLKCPAGTFQDTVGSKNISDCINCPLGYYCDGNDTSVAIPCENGTYCPENTKEPSICQAGFYCPGAKVQTPCPSGFFCPNASISPTPCPIGHYCPGNDNCSSLDAGSSSPTLCPLGNIDCYIILV